MHGVRRLPAPLLQSCLGRPTGGPARAGLPRWRLSGYEVAATEPAAAEALSSALRIRRYAVTAAASSASPSMTAVDQRKVRRMTQFPVPLLRTNVKPARSKRVRVPL